MKPKREYFHIRADGIKAKAEKLAKKRYTTVSALVRQLVLAEYKEEFKR